MKPGTMMPGILIAFAPLGTVAAIPTAVIFSSEITTVPSVMMPAGVRTVPDTAQSAAIAPPNGVTMIAKAPHERNHCFT
jgi:hypothetical protein